MDRCVFPAEVLVQFINDSRTLRRFRQTCRELAALTIHGRWEVTTVVKYDPAHWRTWLIDHRPVNECQLGEETAADRVTITAGAPISTWYSVYAATLAGMYSACLAREYLLTGDDPIMPYRTYLHEFPSETYYTPADIHITEWQYGTKCNLQIDPADFSHDV
jgi:hypothetical protein